MTISSFFGNLTKPYHERTHSLMHLLSHCGHGHAANVRQLFLSNHRKLANSVEHRPCAHWFIFVKVKQNDQLA